MPQRTLITGFGPFPGAPINPTERCVRALQAQTTDPSLRTLVLPVTYAEAFALLEAELRAFRPDRLFMLGLHQKARCVRLERQARNQISTTQVDANGHRSTQQQIKVEGKPSYSATLDVEQLERLIQSCGLDVEQSVDAGSYLCNYTYYRALELVHREGWNTEVVFIHVPPTDDLLTEDLPKRGQVLSIATLQELVRHLVNF